MLAELLGSRLRAKLLGWLFAHPGDRFFVRQLTALLGEDSTNISRELARLERLGILLCKTEGRQKYYQANRKCAVFEELRGLALKTAGLADVLREALSAVSKDIEFAFLYGSQADGTAGAASDIDLMVVGDVEEKVLHSAVSGAEDRLSRQVNYTLLSAREFRKRRKEESGFLARVLTGPKIDIIGSADEIR